METPTPMSVELELPYNSKRNNFTASKNLSRDILQDLQKAKLLPFVLPEIFPERFDGKITIHPNSKEVYLVRFFLKMQAPKEMKDGVMKYLNRSIDVTNNHMLKFKFEIPRKSKYVKKISKEHIVLSFS